MDAPWLLASSVVLVPRNQLDDPRLDLVSDSLRLAEATVNSKVNGKILLAQAPRRSSWDDERTFDVCVTVDERSELGLVYKPRGILVYEVFVPVHVVLEQASAEELTSLLTSLLTKCCSDAARRWKIDASIVFGD
jgi:hypothetical protein